MVFSKNDLIRILLYFALSQWQEKQDVDTPKEQSSSNQWRPQLTRESRGLGNDDDGWNLVCGVAAPSTQSTQTPRNASKSPSSRQLFVASGGTTSKDNESSALSSLEILDVGKQKVLRFLKAMAFLLANSRTLCEQQDTY